MDISQKFKDYYSYYYSRPFTNKILKELKKYKILLIPGLYSSPLRKLSSFLKVSGYFDDHLYYLRKNNIDVDLVPINSEGFLLQNANIIKSFIESSPKPIVILAHSKGGMDSLDALIRWPILQEKIKGFICVQTPFHGTPIADDFCRYRFLKIIANYLVKTQKGSLRCVYSLTTKKRNNYNNRHKNDISNLVKNVKTITFGSWIGYLHPTLLKVPQSRLLLMGIENDGFVPLSSSFLEDTFTIKFKGVDHAATVMSNPIHSFNKNAFVKALLLLVF